MKKNKLQRAFTLLELLVVISIIGILIALGVTSYMTAQRKSRDAKRKADLETVRQSLILYRQDNGDYGDVSVFNDTVSALFTGEYITSSTIIDPKTSDATYFYSLACTGTVVTACSRVELTAPLETETSDYVIYTP